MPAPRPNVICTPPDGDMSRVLEPYEIKMKQLLNLGPGLRRGAVSDGFFELPKVLRNDAGGGDSQLGNLVATSMRLRRRVEADFALTNSLGIRADFESGPLTLEQLYNVFPFDNTITTQFCPATKCVWDARFRRGPLQRARLQNPGPGVGHLLHLELPKPALPLPDQTGAVRLRKDCRLPDLSRAQCPTSLSCSDQLSSTVAQKSKWVGPFADQIVLGDDCRNIDGTANKDKVQTRSTVLPATKSRSTTTFPSVVPALSCSKRNTTRFNTGISLRDALADFIRTLGTDDRYRCKDATKYSNIKGRGPTGDYDYTKRHLSAPLRSSLTTGAFNLWFADGSFR